MNFRLVLAGRSVLLLANSAALGQGFYRWSNFVGSPGGGGDADGTGSAARFSGPGGVAVDENGAVFVADQYNHTIRKVTGDGVVTTFAGKAGIEGSSDGRNGRFRLPTGVAMDPSGNLLVADQTNSTIRKVSSDGVVSTLAGSATMTGSTDGTRGAARFFYPFSVAVDQDGNVFVADEYNNTIRQVTSAGVVTTLAGFAGADGSADGSGGSARFFYPAGVAVSGRGNILVADQINNTIRQVTRAGLVTTLAGNPAVFGSTDGTGNAARVNQPDGVAVDASGNVFVADVVNCTIRKVTSAGVVTTLAGSPGSVGSTDGIGSAARFAYPAGLALDGKGNLFVTDSGNHTIRKVTSAGVVTTLAGSPGHYGIQDGVGSEARFTYPSGVAVDAQGNVYVAEETSNTIRKVTPAGEGPRWPAWLGPRGARTGSGAPPGSTLPPEWPWMRAGTFRQGDGDQDRHHAALPDGTG